MYNLNVENTGDGGQARALSGNPEMLHIVVHKGVSIFGER
jgi:hypothetical protein